MLSMIGIRGARLSADKVKIAYVKKDVVYFIYI